MNKLRIEELEETYPHHKDRSMRNSAFNVKEGLNKTQILSYWLVKSERF